MNKKATFQSLFTAFIVMFSLFILSGCSEISLFTLLSNEQEGDFGISQDVVNIREGTMYDIDAQGGFLPYSFAIVSGDGSINPLTGLYTAPLSAGGLLIVEIESRDRFDSRDTGTIRVYAPLSAVPSAFSIKTDDPPRSIDVSGGYLITAYTAVAERGTISPVDTDTFSYDPPAVAGWDYIEITDDINNSISISVEVLPASTSTVLQLQPTTAVITIGPGASQEFTLTGGSGSFPGDFIIELSDPGFGSLPPDPLPNPFTYTAPSVPGAVTLTVTDGIGDSVFSDIYVVSATPEVLELNPSFVETSPGAILEFTASGGLPPYKFSILSGAGFLEKVSPSTMIIETSSPPPVTKIRVTDAVGSTATANIDLKEK